MSSWADQAIDISTRFNAYIIPLIRKDQPYSKLSLDKWKDKGIPEDKLPSKDAEQIRSWSERFNAYGVVPSKSFLILDVDVKAGQHGKACLKFLKDEGLPTNTFIVQSPSGGLHLYYRHPAHYQPSQSVGDKIKLENSDAMARWETMRAQQGESAGLDTRYGWGYVVGPGSTFGEDRYIKLSDSNLASIPSSMCIGYSTTVNISRPKMEELEDLTDIERGSVSDNRNDHALNWTFKLSLRRYPDSVAEVMIKDAVKFYNNDDGEAPTFHVMWDMYSRAQEKEQDVTSEILTKYVYLVRGRRVMNTHTGEIVKLEEFQGAYSGKFVPIESQAGVKMVNPVKIWEQSPNRIIVHDEMFDISRGHGVIDVELQKGVSQYYNKFVPPDNILLEDAPYSEMGEEMGLACIKVIENIVSSPYDREWFRKWIGQMLFDTGTRPAWHWHIFSNARGIGKDTLASIIARLYGESNIARFGTEAFEDKSNTEFFNCGLGVMSDFAPINGQGGKSKVLAQFKSLTGASVGRMRAMYMDGQQRSVSLRFLMLSNAYNDFPVDNEDRRLFKCESHGVTLHPRVYALTHCFTDPIRVTKEMVDQYGLVFCEDDRRYAQALLLDYFRTSGYEEMSGQFDCPQNDIKDENRATTEAKYFQDVRRAIEHGLYIFASDLVTRDTLALFLDSINVKTSPDAVLRDLLDKGMIYKVKRKTTAGSQRAVMVKLGFMIYDEDLIRILEVGTKTNQVVYCCRSPEFWTDLRASRQCAKELRKIVNYPNIKAGWDAQQYELLKSNKVAKL